ncbi:MAG TPA: flagellar brake protein [Gallionella sp.]|nr:flagellar brake protein [Gallionella sp.]
MSMILVNKNEIAIGKPSPWPLYDQKHKMLVERGGIVRDNEHLDRLLADGVYRELSWEAPSDKNGGNSLSSIKTNIGQPQADKIGSKFTFDDMKLRAESRLQLEPPAQLGRDRIPVKVIGYLRDVSLLVTVPVAANGARLQLMEGESVVMRFFSGQNAFAFACTVERACKLPYEYLHLSFPDAIEGIEIRKAARVKTRIIAAVQNNNSCSAGEQVSALISNISANGAALDTKHPLGKKNDILNLAFRVNLHKIDAFLSIKGIIRAVRNGGDADISDPETIRHGIEFQNLQPNDMIILQSMIYQQIAESPHHLA